MDRDQQRYSIGAKGSGSEVSGACGRWIKKLATNTPRMLSKATPTTSMTEVFAAWALASLVSWLVCPSGEPGLVSAAASCCAVGRKVGSGVLVGTGVKVGVMLASFVGTRVGSDPGGFTLISSPGWMMYATDPSTPVVNPLSARIWSRGTSYTAESVHKVWPVRIMCTTEPCGLGSALVTGIMTGAAACCVPVTGGTP